MQNYANCIHKDNTLLFRYSPQYMKIQTPRLNPIHVYAKLHTNTSFSRSGYEIQGRRQPQSSGGTISVWGTGEWRSKGPTAGGSWRGGNQLGSLGERCKLPRRGPEQSPGRWKFFLHSVPPDCLSWHLCIILQVCVELFMHMTATHFHGPRHVYSPC